MTIKFNMNQISQTTLRLHSEDYSVVLHNVMITLTSKCTNYHQFFSYQWFITPEKSCVDKDLIRQFTNILSHYCVTN